MPEAEIPPHNFMIDCQRFHGELLDIEQGIVWQSQQPITREAYQALEIPATLVKVGIGRGVMDAHYFRRSPGAAEDGPVSEMDVAGHLFVHCANPPAGGPESPAGDDPKLLRVDKHHSLIFETGRELDVIRLPGGRDYVQVIAASPEGGGILQRGSTPEARSMGLPEGWTLRTEKLRAHTTIHLPNPTEAWFFASGASFQGPVETFASK